MYQDSAFRTLTFLFLKKLSRMAVPTCMVELQVQVSWV